MSPPTLGHDSSSDGDAPTSEARFVPSTGIAHLSAEQECVQVFVNDTEEGRRGKGMHIVFFFTFQLVLRHLAGNPTAPLLWHLLVWFFTLHLFVAYFFVPIAV